MSIGIIYDFDGTLSSITERFINPIINPLSKFGGELSENVIQDGLTSLIKVISNKDNMKIPIILWDIGRATGLSVYQRVKFLIRSFLNFRQSEYNYVPMIGSEQSLTIAHKRGNVAIVTSASREEIEVAKQKIPELCIVEQFVTRDDVDKVKPDPEALLLACTKMGVNPENSIYIGDLPSDIQAAKNAGMISVAFLGEYKKYTQKLLEEAQPDYMVEDHRDLVRLLKQLSDE